MIKPSKSNLKVSYHLYFDGSLANGNIVKDPNFCNNQYTVIQNNLSIHVNNAYDVSSDTSEIHRVFNHLATLTFSANDMLPGLPLDNTSFAMAKIKRS